MHKMCFTSYSKVSTILSLNALNQYNSCTGCHTATDTTTQHKDLHNIIYNVCKSTKLNSSLMTKKLFIKHNRTKEHSDSQCRQKTFLHVKENNLLIQLLVQNSILTETDWEVHLDMSVTYYITACINIW